MLYTACGTKLPEQKQMKINLANGVILLTLILTLVSGCSPDIRTTVFQHNPSKHVNAPIKIFRFKSPQCNFEEVGIVNSRQRNKLISMNEVMESLRIEARRLGGDAIIGLNETNPIHNIDTQYGTLDRDPVLSGTIIKFTDATCTN